MALSGDRLGLAIAAYFTTDPDLTASEKTAIESNWKNIAKEIVDEFKNHAETKADALQPCNITGILPPHPQLTGTVS